jgi:heme exporter protein D
MEQIDAASASNWGAAANCEAEAAKLWEGHDRARRSDSGREAGCMSAHALYVTAAYGITAIVLAGLIGWILLDQRARKRELAELEAAGVRRRSDKASKP